MHIGFMTIHPLTVPFGNELVFAISSVINTGVLVYSGVIKPEIQLIQDCIKLL